jgi:hypothetical protein
VCCQERSLRRADHSSRGVLPTVVRLVCDLETSGMRRPWPTGESVSPEINKHKRKRGNVFVALNSSSYNQKM